MTHQPQTIHDSVEHPRHYTIGGIEVIDAIEAWSLGFHLGNVVKYVARAAHKGSYVEDLRKAPRRADELNPNAHAPREIET